MSSSIAMSSLSSGSSIRAPAPKMDAPTRATTAWLRAWDKAPRSTRERMLARFAHEHAGRTAPEIERALGISASLVFARLVSWLRLTAPTGTAMTAQLNALKVFVCAASSDRFAADLVSSGGLQTLVDVIALPTVILPHLPKREAIVILDSIAANSREYRETMCALQVPAVVVTYAGAAQHESCVRAATALLVTLSAANPRYVHAVHREALDLLVEERNPLAQRYGGEALRLILAALDYEELYDALRTRHRAEDDDDAGEEGGGAAAAAPAGSAAKPGAKGGEEEEEEDEEEAQARLAAAAAAAAKAALADAPEAAEPGTGSRGGTAGKPERRARSRLGADPELARARRAALDSALVLSPAYVDGGVALLQSFSIHTQRVGGHILLLLAEHKPLHELLLLRMRAVLIEARAMHAQAAVAHVIGQLLGTAPLNRHGADPPRDESSVLAAHEARISIIPRTNRELLAERLVGADFIPLLVGLLMHMRSHECRRQAAVSLQTIARFGSPAAAAAVQQYAAPVFSELLDDPLGLSSAPLEEGVRQQISALVSKYRDQLERAAAVSFDQTPPGSSEATPAVGKDRFAKPAQPPVA